MQPDPAATLEAIRAELAPEADRPGRVRPNPYLLLCAAAEVIEYQRAQVAQHLDDALLIACQDTTEYDNALTDRVCDRLMGAITDDREPCFGGERLNMLVRLIRDLKAQACA